MLTAGGVVAKQGLDVVSEFEVEAEGGDGDWAAVGVEAGVVDELVIGGKEDVFGYGRGSNRFRGFVRGRSGVGRRRG
jgi:hypothetical protein